jgi:hypothetical protein
MLPKGSIKLAPNRLSRVQVMTDHQLIDFLWFAAYGVVAFVACAVLVIGVIARNYRWRLRRALER